MLDKSKVDPELARRLCAAYVRIPGDGDQRAVGDLWYFLAALADKLARESQGALYGDLGRLATEMIQ